MSTAKATAAATTKPTAAPKAARTSANLCTSNAARPAPREKLKTAQATGAPPLPPIAFGVGKWVWVNLWASWCGPCKEEMPRLLAWQKKLAESGVRLELAFVSIDDDARQMQRFLDTQPVSGVRATYWLEEGSGRASFTSALGLKEAPDLPVHAIFAPTGQLACMIQGAVDDADFPAVSQLLTKL